MRFLRFLALSLCLTAPATARAQESSDAPRDAAPVAPVPLVTASAVKPDHEMRAPIGCRLAGETLGGALVGSSGLALGFLGGLLLADSVSCGIDDCNQGRRIAVGLSAVGLGLGAASGVYLAGSLMDARGRYLPTLLGALAGAGVPLAVSAISGAEVESAPILVSFLALPVVGAILGYELSNPLSRRTTSTSMGVVPTVALTPDGGSLGLVGRF